MLIYCATSPSDKKYIGQTRTTLYRRWYMHRWVARHGGGNAIGAAIRKWGEKNFRLEVLGEANTQKELDALEIRFIEYFETMNPEKGYNLVLGGDGGIGWWAGRKRKPISAEHAEKLHASRRGVPLTKEHREKLSASRMGRFPMSEDHKEKLRHMNTGRKLSQESIKKRNSTFKINWSIRRKEVLARVKELLDSNRSITSIAEDVGFERHTVSKWVKKYLTRTQKPDTM